MHCIVSAGPTEICCLLKWAKGHENPVDVAKTAIFRHSRRWRPKFKDSNLILDNVKNDVVFNCLLKKQNPAKSTMPCRVLICEQSTRSLSYLVYAKKD